MGTPSKACITLLLACACVLTLPHSDLGIDLWQLLPFSRGNVTIKVCSIYQTAQPQPLTLPCAQSANPFQKPAVNVNYFSVDWDLDVQIAGARLSRKILSSPPLRCVLSVALAAHRRL